MKKLPKFTRMNKSGSLFFVCFLAGFGWAFGLSNSPSKTMAADPIKVLLVGGGASHDFDTWYKNADVKTLEKDGFAEVTYTDDPNLILDLLEEVDVLYLSNNQPIADQATRKAIFEFAASGKGLILAHAALWYNWEDWPEYNTDLVSGGSRGHDRYGAFDVNIKAENHPVMEGLPPTFNLKDELYYFKVDPKGPGIEVLAEASANGADPFPSVFVINHPNTRMVGIALGHDGESHDLEVYQKLLRNAVNWVAKKHVTFNGGKNAERIDVPDTDELLIKPIKYYTKLEKKDDPNHVSFLQGAGHGGSHPHLVQEFVPTNQP